MRLTQQQASIIRTTVQEIFGQSSEVYLFGSRTNDALKGGDIDLYIVPEDKETTLQHRLTLHARLEIQLGEQQLDIIVAKDPTRLIEQEALKTGVKL